MEKLCECGCGLPVPTAKQSDYRYGIIKGQPRRFISGHNTLKHGMSFTREYKSYISAKGRCTNPWDVSWEDYGGRGIQFLFTSFEQFFAELGPRPAGMSIDRLENDGNYEPGNVRWATKQKQRWNQRARKAAQNVGIAA